MGIGKGQRKCLPTFALLIANQQHCQYNRTGTVGVWVCYSVFVGRRIGHLARNLVKKATGRVPAPVRTE
jgi:hypothetical protein